VTARFIDSHESKEFIGGDKMRTVTKEINVYEYSELSDKAKAHAFDLWSEGQEFCWSSEYRDTLKEFEKYFDVKVDDWNVDTCNYNYRFLINEEPEFKYAGPLKTIKEKIRVSKYIIEKLAKYIDFQKTDDYIFTGFCADCDILGIYNMVKNWKAFFTDYDDFIRASLENFFSAWSKDMDYCFSEGNFKENYAKEEQYLENGEVYR
jgi:hypothetical protein